jgi:hypothetical protein
VSFAERVVKYPASGLVSYVFGNKYVPAALTKLVVEELEVYEKSH